MQIGPLIAEGRTAEIFDLGPDRILKLMRPEIAGEVGEWEVQAAAAIDAAGLTAPRLLETVRVDGRLGLIYERVDGPSMLAALERNPLRTVSLARDFARLHAEMHATSGDGRGLPGLKPSLVDMIERSPLVPPNARTRALERLDRLPDGDSILHYDFHPGNILMAGAGPRVIDWMTVKHGDPAADVARTLFRLRGAAPPPRGTLGRLALGGVRRVFVATYRRSYRQLMRFDPAAVRAWRPVVLTARLAEGIAEERTWLLAEIAEAER